MTEVNLRLVEGLKFEVETGRGVRFSIESRAPDDGHSSSPSPMELVLTALGGCGAMDIISILRKMRQDVTAYEVHVDGERSDEHPRVYTSAVMTHRLRGRDLNEQNVRRAIFLSMTTYCPVFAMLSPQMPIAVRYEIEDEAGGAARTGYVQIDVPEPATQA